ncbi:MAG: NAD-dependent deacylase [Bacteroidetes bacterium]|jgi:NAD-dependent deacetylase|nr:NAD-dependent deacylase [Bacteroidota bacterium]MCA6444837.1 NAD-dependent deacylase [Bacteroidota bacterium]
MRSKKIVVFTGAGISADSGIKTFRDADGLWENHRIEDVATPEAWQRNKELVLKFYNERRKQLKQVEPNAMHLFIADLDKKHEVKVITQNVDNLHERAGSKHVLHLHGELIKARSTVNPNLVYTLKKDTIELGDKCELNSQLRPHIVWFGEEVPEMEKAYELTEYADLFIVIGTSLNVYPAANLLTTVSAYTPKVLVDPGTFNLDYVNNLKHIKSKAAEGVSALQEAIELFLK